MLTDCYFLRPHGFNAEIADRRASHCSVSGYCICFKVCSSIVLKPNCGFSMMGELGEHSPSDSSEPYIDTTFPIFLSS